MQGKLEKNMSIKKSLVLRVSTSTGTWRWKIGRLSGYIYLGRPPFSPKGRSIILGFMYKPKKSKVKKEKVRFITTHYREGDKLLYNEVVKYAQKRHIGLAVAQLELIILGGEKCHRKIPKHKRKS